MSASEAWQRGPIAWMARNSVTANLLMLTLILGGLFMTTRVQQEVFPAFAMDFVTPLIIGEDKSHPSSWH